MKEGFVVRRVVASQMIRLVQKETHVVSIIIEFDDTRVTKLAGTDDRLRYFKTHDIGRARIPGPVIIRMVFGVWTGGKVSGGHDFFLLEQPSVEHSANKQNK